MDQDKIRRWFEAVEATRILHMPERQLATFGSTNLRYFCLSSMSRSPVRTRIFPRTVHAENPEQTFSAIADDLKYNSLTVVMVAPDPVYFISAKC